MPDGPDTRAQPDHLPVETPREKAVFDWLRTPLEPGATLIEASAGTGKTFTLAAIFVRLILEAPADAPLDPRRILVGTFSRAATAELRERLRRALHETLETLRHTLRHGVLPEGADLLGAHVYSSLPEPAAQLPPLLGRLEGALRDFDDAAIFTLHSFFQRVLAQNPFESGLLFSTKLEPDAEPIFQELAEDFWRRHCYDAHPLFLALLLRKGTTPDSLVFKARTLSSRGQLRIEPAYESSLLSRLENGLENTLAAAARALAEEREGILKAIGPGGTRVDNFNLPINKNSHAHPRMLDELAAVLDGTFPYPGECLGLIEYFSQSTLESVVTKRPAAKAADTRAWIGRRTLFPLLDELSRLTQAWFAALNLEFVHHVAVALENKARERDLHTFNSLETRVHEILSDPERGRALRERLREDYAVCLLDEFQDTNRIQANIFFTIFQELPLFLIGDPKQAIYEFRGADLNAYLWAAEKADRAYTLPHNFRSSPALVRGVQAIFSRRPYPFVKRGIELPRVEAAPNGNKAVKTPLTWPSNVVPSPGLAAPLQLVYFQKDAQRDPERAENSKFVLKRMLPWVAEEIRRLLGSGLTIEGKPLKTSDIAILVNRNDTARQVYKVLQSAGFASVLASTASVWESAAAGELYRVLLAISRLEDEALLRGALATSLCGFDGHALHHLQSDESAWEDLRYAYRGYQETWLRDGFGVMFQQWLQGQGVRERLLHRLDGERVLVDLQHLADLIAERALAQELGLVGVLNFCRKRMEEAIGRQAVPEAEQLRREKDEAAIQIVTVHKSKGLEYPVTFVMEGWHAGPLREIIYHDDERDQLVWFHRGVGENDEEDDSPDAAEFVDSDLEAGERARQEALKVAASANLRLFYVGLTRAQHRCYLLHTHAASGDTKQGKLDLNTQTPPLGYLLNGGPVVPSDVETWRKQNDAKLLADLVSLATSHPEEIALHRVEYSDNLQPFQAPPPAGAVEVAEARRELLEAREFTAAIPRNWRIHSFSGLKHTRPERTELAAAAAPPPEVQAGPGADEEEAAPAPAIAPEEEAVETAPAAPADPWSIHALTPGARTGSMLHQLLERLEFTDLRGIEAIAERSLYEYGLDQRFAAAIGGTVRKALATPLVMPSGALPGLRLADVGPEDRLAEMQFWLPMRQFLPARLSEALRRHTSANPLYAALADDLHHLESTRLKGFLTGFVDLVCQQGGLYYIIDWKTNRLGENTAAYAPPALAAAMQADLYTLQYLLYTVALHRHLRQRLPDYKYGEHFGGVAYLFLRGAAAFPGNGAYCDRPPAALIEELSAIFG